MSAPENTIALMAEKLQHAFSPSHLNIIDESHLHAGHAGAQSGKGHYALEIETLSLEKRSRVEQHKAIYQALGALMQTHIHALRIQVNQSSETMR